MVRIINGSVEMTKPESDCIMDYYLANDPDTIEGYVNVLINMAYNLGLTQHKVLLDKSITPPKNKRGRPKKTEVKK